jgi:hypothetical protein
MGGYMASDDPQFEEKAADIIALYMDPPQHAAVFCVDEKTAIQALDRLDPVLSCHRAGLKSMDSSTTVTEHFRFTLRRVSKPGRSMAGPPDDIPETISWLT